jgi:hypothetical protein
LHSHSAPTSHASLFLIVDKSTVCQSSLSLPKS